MHDHVYMYMDINMTLERNGPLGRPGMKYGTLFQRPRSVSLCYPLSSGLRYGYTAVAVCMDAHAWLSIAAHGVQE